jgi:surface protein
MLAFAFPAVVTILAFRAGRAAVKAVEKTNRYIKMLCRMRTIPITLTMDMALRIYHNVPVELRVIIHGYFCESVDDANFKKAVRFFMGRKYDGIMRYGYICWWDTSQVTTMSGPLFRYSNFNWPLRAWNVSNVTTMHHMFEGVTDFNQDIGNWDVSNVTDMNFMFFKA